MKKLHVKNCEICGKAFETYNARTLTCSEECSLARKRIKYKEYKQNHPEMVKASQEKSRQMRYGNGKIGKLKKKKSWIKVYEKANALTKMSMLAKVNATTYGKLQVLKNTNPNEYKKMEFLTLSRMSDVEY